MSTQTTAQKMAEEVKSLPSAKNGNTAENQKKANILQTIEKFKPEPFKSAQDRISRKNQFDALAKLYEQLKVNYNQLRTFHAGNDTRSA